MNCLEVAAFVETDEDAIFGLELMEADELTDRALRILVDPEGKVIDVELGGALILEMTDGKLMRQRTRAPPAPKGNNAEPGPRSVKL